MDRDKVLELAREARLAEPTHPFNPWGASDDGLERFAALIEREVRGDAKPALWLTKDGLKTALGEESQTGVKGRVSASAPEDYIALYTLPAPAVVRQLVDGLAGLIDFIEIDSLRIDQDALRIARAALAAAKDAGL